MIFFLNDIPLIFGLFKPLKFFIFISILRLRHRAGILSRLDCLEIVLNKNAIERCRKEGTMLEIWIIFITIYRRSFERNRRAGLYVVL